MAVDRTTRPNPAMRTTPHDSPHTGAWLLCVLLAALPALHSHRALAAATHTAPPPPQTRAHPPLDIRCGAGPIQKVKRWCQSAPIRWSPDSIACTRVVQRARRLCSSLGARNTRRRTLLDTAVSTETQHAVDLGNGPKVHTYLLDLRVPAAASARDLCARRLRVDASQVDLCAASVMADLQRAHDYTTGAPPTPRAPPVNSAVADVSVTTAASAQLHAGFPREELITALGGAKGQLHLHGGLAKTVVLNLSNKGYIEWIPGWVDMVTAHGVGGVSGLASHARRRSRGVVYLIVALDSATEQFCKQSGYTCVRWRGPPDAYLGTAKLAATRDLLALGLNVVCSEMDVLWVKNPLPLLGVGVTRLWHGEDEEEAAATLRAVRDGDALQWNPEICHWCSLQTGWRPNQNATYIRGEDADLQFSSHALSSEVNIGFYFARARHDGRSAQVFARALHAVEMACRPKILQALQVTGVGEGSAAAAQTEGWPTNACAHAYNEAKSWRLDQFCVDQVLGNSRPNALSHARVKRAMLGSAHHAPLKRRMAEWKTLDYNVFGSGDGVDTYDHLVTIHAFQPMRSDLAMQVWFDQEQRQAAMAESETGWADIVESALRSGAKGSGTGSLPVYLPQLLSAAGDDGMDWILRGSPRDGLSCQGMLTHACGGGGGGRNERTQTSTVTSIPSTTPGNSWPTALRMLTPWRNQVVYAGSDILAIDARIVGPVCDQDVENGDQNEVRWLRVCVGVSWFQWLYTVKMEHARVNQGTEKQGNVCRNVTLQDMCMATTKSRTGRLHVGDEWNGRMVVSVTAVAIFRASGGRQAGMSLQASRLIEVVPSQQQLTAQHNVQHQHQHQHQTASPVRVRVVHPAPFTQVSSNMTVSLGLLLDNAALIMDLGRLQQWLQSMVPTRAANAAAGTDPLNMHVCLAMASLHFPRDTPVRNLGCLPLFDASWLASSPLGPTPPVRTHSHLKHMRVTNIPYGEHDLVIVVHADDGSGRPGVKLPLTTQTVRFLSTVMIDGKTRVGQPYARRAVGDYLRCAAMAERMQLRVGRAPFVEDKEQLHQQLTMGVLVHRGLASFEKSVASWYQSQLLLRVTNIVVYLQEWPLPNDGAARSLEEVAKADVRLAPMLSVALAYPGISPRVVVIGAPMQVNIAPAFSRLVIAAAEGGGGLFMFVEEDFVVDMDLMVQGVVEQRMEDAMQRLVSADVVRLRSKQRPGDPDCARKNWQGREREMLVVRSGDVARHKVLDATMWLEDPHEVFSREMVWECGEDRSGGATRAERWWCAYSTNAGWTNNPFLAKTAWLLREIVPIAEVEWTRRIESAVNLSPPLWDDACFVVAAGEGIFTHSDEDRPLEVQSPCERARDEALFL
jgi:hypothetical protein